MIDSLESRRLFSIAVTGGVLLIQGTSSAETLSVSWDTAGSGSVRASDGSTTTTISLSTTPFNSVSIYGGNGNDTIYGALSVTGFTSPLSLRPVVMNGGAALDTLSGSNSNDTLYGGSGNDTLNGNGGDDRIAGEGALDSLNGGSGDDVMDGVYDGSSADTMTGGTGIDHFHANYSGATIIDSTDASGGEIIDHYGAEITPVIEGLKTTATYNMTDSDFQSADFLSTDTTPLVDRGKGIVAHFRASPATLSAYPSKRFVYTIDFGDASGTSRYNEVKGFSGAHIYYGSGTRTVTLTIQDSDGGVVYSDSINATINASSYANAFYVDGTSGSDSNSGTSTGSAVKTLDKAIQLINGTSGDVRVLLKRGTNVLATTPPRIDKSNVFIGSDSSYTAGGGATSAKVYMNSGAPSGNDQEILSPNLDAKNVIIQGLDLDGSSSRDGQFFAPRGVNASLIDCTYNNVFYLANVRPSAVGAFIMDNDADIFDNTTITSEYGIFGDVAPGGFGTGGDQKSAMLSAFGNRLGLGAEHRIRTNTDYANFVDNDLLQYAGPSSGSWNTIRVNSGDNVYWSGNTHRGGQSIIAQLLSQPNDPYAVAPTNVVVDGDLFIAAPIYSSSVTALPRIRVTSNASNVTVRNNVIEMPSGKGVDVGPTSSNILIAQNTFYNVSLGQTIDSYNFNGTRGVAVTLSSNSGADDRVEVVGNLYHAPSLTEDADSAGIKYEKSGTGDFAAIDLVKQNVWPSTNIKLFYYLNTSSVMTGITLTSWNALTNFNAGDLGITSTFTGSYVPTSSTVFDVVDYKQFGIIGDKYGTLRNKGKWTAGAVEST